MRKKTPPPPPTSISTTQLVKPDVATGRDPYGEFVVTLPDLGEMGPKPDGYPGGPSSATIAALRGEAERAASEALRVVQAAIKEIDELLRPTMLNRTPRSEVRRRIAETVRNGRAALAHISTLSGSAGWLAKLSLPFWFGDANVSSPAEFVVALGSEQARPARAGGHEVAIPGVKPGDVVDRGWAVPAKVGAVIVHMLRFGRSFCEISTFYGVPATWPAGHKWSARPEKITCADCKKSKAFLDQMAALGASARTSLLRSIAHPPPSRRSTGRVVKVTAAKRRPRPRRR